MLPTRPAFVFRAVRLRRVLDDDKSMAAGDVHDRVHVRRLPVEVHGQDRLCSRRNGGLNRRWIHRERTRLNIDQNRARTRVENCGHAGDESKRHRDDFIPRSDALPRGAPGARRWFRS